MTWVWFFAKVIFAVAFMMTIGPAFTLVERKVSAWIQGRVGPDRVGPWGTMQPLADLIKFMFKEEILPIGADRILYLAGPMLVFVPPFFGFCVMPFGNQIGDEHLQVVNLNIGVLFVMSVLSIAVYGITLGGWASNNKYSLMGGLRASAQLISYELTLGLSILIAVMMCGTLDLQEIVLHQARYGWNLFGGGTWLALPCGILASILLFVTGLAENNRLPFDLAECDAELVGGYHTEYSGMNLAIFMLSEYIAMITMASLVTTLYLGGWSFPGLTHPDDHGVFAGLLSVAIFTTKVLILMFSYVWIRWTLPRFKYNQLMDLGWKVFLPVSLTNIAVLAVVGVLFSTQG